MSRARADSRRQTRRTAIVAAATLALSAIGSVTSAYAASGGCNRQTKGPFTFSACVNQPNAWTVQADGYIDVKPIGCFDIRIDIRDKYGDVAKAGSWQRACGTGHYVGAQLGFSDFNRNNPWFSEFTIVQGASSYVIDSPYIG
jgi:hypothetical protein